MSAIGEIWMGELAKLKEKVMARKPLLSKAKEGFQVEQTVEKEVNNKKDNRGIQRDTSMMSEATVCLLMDRFVPW